MVTKKGYVKDLKEKIIADKTLAVVKPLISHEQNKPESKEKSSTIGMQFSESTKYDEDNHHLFGIERIENLSNLYIQGKLLVVK